MRLRQLVPAWLQHYQRQWLSGDLTAGLIVTVMLIPQSLAYAMLAGLPPEMGLYASILPLFAYALFGTSMSLAVGPVAVASLMTASALTPLAAVGSPEYISLAVLLALLSGLMLFLFGLLRLGFLAYFLSHPVISGFISGSAVLIAIGQFKYILGIKLASGNALSTVTGLIHGLAQANPTTSVISVAALLSLFAARRYLGALLQACGLRASSANLMTRLAPMAVVIIATAIVASLRLDQSAAVAVVGHVPSGLPVPSLPVIEWQMISVLWLPALLISLVFPSRLR